MLLSITPVSVRPPKLVESILSIFEAEMKSNGIHCDVKSDSSLTTLDVGRVYLDPSRVTQVFINLLTNAIKFVKPSKEPSISIRYGASLSKPRSFFPESMYWATDSKQDGDVTSSPEWGRGEEVYLTFSVQDSGIGLQGKEIHKIFERFRQANVKTHVKYGGSGLGLFISKELTEKQGGEIGVSSLHGQGSTFGFYVKARRVAQQPPTFIEMPKGIRQGNTVSHQLRVLLVEDNLINQQVLGKQLKKAGCMVAVANHGLEALQILDEDTFDVCLMDLEMPASERFLRFIRRALADTVKVLDGLAATSQIRKKELASEGLLGQAMSKSGPRAGARLPIIVVTANVRKEQIDTAIAAGAVRTAHLIAASLKAS
jgi:CheY-like chemotaxis protein